MKTEVGRREPRQEKIPADDRQPFNAPMPERLPQPTYSPAALALGIVLLLWGVVTTVALSAVGLILSALALARWIGELRHGNR